VYFYVLSLEYDNNLLQRENILKDDEHKNLTHECNQRKNKYDALNSKHELVQQELLKVQSFNLLKIQTYFWK
jgi:hypothetical protein